MTATNSSHIATTQFPNAIGWEESLARHYLRADGPWGPSVLRHLDVTPEQLARAIGRGDEDADEALRAFLRALIGDRDSVRDIFVRGVKPGSSKADVPGFFRYLVLSSVIAACSEELSIERDYRERMREVMGDDFRFGNMPGLPKAWLALVEWATTARREGQPIRAIKLPDPQHMVQIGYSCFIAFPYRRDRDRLRKLVENNCEHAFRTPPAVLTTLDRAAQRNTWSPGFSAALDDFRSRVQRCEVLLSTHPIWELVRSIIDEVRRDSHHEREESGVLRLLVGFDDTDLAMEFQGPAPLFEGPAALDGGTYEYWVNDRLCYLTSGPIMTVIEAVQRMVAARHSMVSDIAPGLALGFLAFESTGVFGRWIHRPNFDERPHRILVLRRTPFPRESQDADVQWKTLGGGWFLSQPLSPAEYDDVRRRLGLERQDVSYSPGRLRIVQGIRVGRKLLGRPCSMPCLVTPMPASVDLRPSIGSIGEIALKASPDLTRWQLTANGATSGRWIASAWESDDDKHEGALATTAVDLTPEALEHIDLKGADGAGRDLIAIPEIETGGRGNPVDISHIFSTEDEAIDVVLLDLLEAIYAGGRSGWSEVDLVGLVRRSFDVSIGEAFDDIRSLQEAGVLDVLTFARWRSRRWYLRAPRLVIAGSGINAPIVFDGTPCARIVERFGNTVYALGGVLFARKGVGSLSPPTYVAVRCDGDELAARLAWPVERAYHPNIGPAPSCWVLDSRTSRGFDVTRSWWWDHGRFVDGEMRSANGVTLRRWKRSDRLQRDLFEIELEGHIFAFSSRVAAILEAHRLAGKALFAYEHNMLIRTAQDGYLPIEVARTIRLAVLRSSGPVGPASRGKPFGYVMKPHVFSWMSSLFGPAIGGVATDDVADALILALARSRRTHEPLAWSGHLDHPRHARLPRFLTNERR